MASDMAKHSYHYHGADDRHLPLHGITVKGGDARAVYQTDLPINHPDFKEISKPSERKEREGDK